MGGVLDESNLSDLMNNNESTSVGDIILVTNPLYIPNNKAIVASLSEGNWRVAVPSLLK